MPRAPSPPPVAEDELEDLPPLDGDAEEPRSEVEVDDELDDSSDESLDDSTGEDDPVDASEIETDDAQTSWLDDAGDSGDLDLGEAGAVDVREDAGDDGDDDPQPVGSEDFGFDETERVVLDGGDEGPVDPDEELRDEDLPALDADDEGEADDASFWEGRLGADEPVGFAWASVPWARVGAPLALVQARALAFIARGALVSAQTEAGVREMMRVDLEGAVEPLAVPGFDVQAVRRLSADATTVAVVLDGGEVFLGDAEAVRFEAVAPGVSVADAVIAGGALWVRTTSGALLYSTDRGRSWARCPVPGTVVALERDEGGADIAALVTDDTRQPIALVRATAAGALVRTSLEGLAAVSVPAVFAARGGSFAYVARTGRLMRVRPDAGWASFDWEGKITALSFVDASSTLLVATYAEADEATALVRLDAAGRPAIVARLGPAVDLPDSDGRVGAIASDDSRGVVWVAGGFGVVAFAVPGE